MDTERDSSQPADPPHPVGSRRFEHFEHAADVGVRGIAPTLEGAFEQAGCALTAAVCEIERVEPRRRVDFEARAGDRELLLYAFLNALIYEMATRRMLFSQFTVQIAGTTLSAQALGEPIDEARHAPAVEPKGATLTALRVAHTEQGWIAQCVVDV